MKVLVVDDDKNTRYLVEVMCREESFGLAFAGNGQEALEMLRQDEEIRLILSDLRMPRMDGENLLAAVTETAPHIPVVIMTSYGSVDNAVKFLKAGATDYITKPLIREVLLHRINSVIATYRLAEQLDNLKREVERKAGLKHIIGRSPALMEILKNLPSIAKTSASVVVGGESGTGKELIARAIHVLSERAQRPFVTVNCAALPEALLESELFGHKKGAFTDATRNHDGLVKEADEGTLFLDEIGEMSPSVQVKLLRFLQEKEYKPVGSTKTEQADVRIVSATNRDLLEDTRTGLFREDLFYRLNIIPLLLPPLRERTGDIGLLADYFLRKFSAQVGKQGLRFDPMAIHKLVSYHWPGNIRELENRVMQAVVMCDGEQILSDMIQLPELETEEGEVLRSFKEEKARVVQDFETGYVSRALAAHSGNVSRAARAAGMDRKNFWQIMKKHGVRAKDFARPSAH